MGKYRDTESNRVVEMDGDQAARLAGVKAKHGGPRFLPVSGSHEVAITDATGQVSIHEMDPEAVHTAQSVQNPNIHMIGDSNREAVHQLVADQNEERAWRAIANEQVAETFLGNVIPGSRALDRYGMSEEERAHDVMMTQYQDEENPIAAGLGKVTGMLGASLVPVPGLGAAAGLFRAGKTGKSAMSLFGFADEAGEALALGLAHAGIPKIAARYAGTLGAGAVMNLPMSVQFQAAQAVDYDRPLTQEAFARNLGTHMMLGAAIDSAIPLLRGVGAAYRAVAPGAHTLKLAGKVPGLSKVGKFGERMLQKNTARRMAAKEAADEYAKQSAQMGKSIAEIQPSKMKTNATGAPQSASLKRMEKALDEIAATNPEIAAMPEFAVVRGNVSAISGLGKRVNTLTNKADQAADVLFGYLRSPSVPQKFAGKGKEGIVDLRKAANDIRVELSAMGHKGKIADELESLLTMSSLDRTAVERVFAFRNQKMVQGMASPEEAVVGHIVRKHVDDALGRLDSGLADALKYTDELFDATKAMKNASGKIRDINKHTTTEGFGAGEMAVSLDRIQAASEGLGALRVLQKKDIGYAGGKLQGAKTLLEDAGSSFEVAAAMNHVRGMASNEFKAATHTPLSPSPEVATFGMFEAVGQYFQDASEVIQGAVHAATHGQVQRGVARSPMTTGVWQYRSMETADEKQAAYNDVRERVLQLTATDDSLMRGVEGMTKGLQADPELAQAVAGQAVTAAMYVKQHLPTGPKGVVDYRGHRSTPAERSKVLEIVGALDDPVSVMDAYLRGEGRAAGLHAVGSVYPRLLADMRMMVAETFIADPEVYGSLPYRIRLGIDSFVGGGFEPSAQPAAIVNFQNRAAQTQAQDQALRGGTGKRPEPGSDSASDRLASF